MRPLRPYDIQEARLRPPAAVPASAVFIPSRHHLASAPARTITRLGTILLPLALLGCRELDLVAPPNSAASATAAALREAPIVLRGSVILPAGVMKHGYVGIANGRILSVSEKQPNIPGAIVVNTDGIILPGFVDVHNHVIWNVLPRWRPSRTFGNQPEWGADPEYA